MNTKFGLPEKLPKITVTPTSEKTFEVENKEIRWCFARPVIGEVTTWCIYDMPDWTWDNEVTRFECIGKAKVHDIDCYILKSEDFILENNVWVKNMERNFYVNQTETFTRTIATMEQDRNCNIEFSSFYDENFIDNWGKELPIRLSDETKISRNEKGEYITAYDGLMVCDRCNVLIGDKEFDCIRVIDLTWFSDRNRSILMEGFFTKDGRTLLARRYNAPMWNVSDKGYYKIPWDQRFPDNNRLVINGIKFTHWYDSVSSSAF